MRGRLTKDNLSAMNKYFAGEKQLRTLEDTKGNIKNNFNLAENLFTKSWFYKGVTNPYKRVLQSKEYSQESKLAMIRLIGDHGTALEAQQNGMKAPDSVYINASAYEGEWVRRYDELLDVDFDSAPDSADNGEPSSFVWKNKQIPVITGVGPVESLISCLDMLCKFHKVPFRRDIVERAAVHHLRTNTLSLELLADLSGFSLVLVCEFLPT